MRRLLPLILLCSAAYASRGITGTDVLSGPTTDLPISGSVSFREFHTWAQGDGVTHHLFTTTSGTTPYFNIQKNANGNFYVQWVTAGWYSQVYVVSGTYTLPANNWNVITATWALGAAYPVLYINGVTLGTNDNSGVIAATSTSSNHWLIGNEYTGTEPWNGSIADVGVWNVAISSTSVGVLNVCGNHPSSVPTGLVNEWDLTGSSLVAQAGGVDLSATGTTTASDATCSVAAGPHTWCQGVGGCTTSAIATTGASAIVAHVSVGGGGGFTDSKGNTWTSLTPHTNSATSQMFCVANPITDAAHTFSTDIPNSTIVVQAFYGTSRVSCPDAQSGDNGGGASVGSIQPGTVTATIANSLLVSGLVLASDDSTVVIDSGTISEVHLFVGGVAYGGALAWNVVSGAQNPTWTFATGTHAATTSAVLNIDVGSTCVITTTSLPAGTVGSSYSQTPASSNCTSPTWTVSVGSLPAGLSISSSTGAITGTPTTTGTSSFTIAVSSSNGSSTKALSILVNASAGCSITTTSFLTGGVGTAYSQTLTSTGCTGPTWSVSIGSLPAGLSLNSSTGAVTGTPTTTGTSNFTIAISSSTGSNTKALSIVIVAAPVISSLAAAANSPNSVNLIWTTSSKTSSQASCGTATGGPYTYASPTVDPVKSGGDDYYGVTSHSLAVVVPTTNTSSSAYFCRVVSVDSLGNSVTSSEVSSGTTAALANQPFVIATGPQGWIPYNDQKSGRNGSNFTGLGYRSDSFYCAWAGDGNNYCSANDTWGVTTGSDIWTATGLPNLIATGVVKITDGLTITLMGNTTGLNSTGYTAGANFPTTYTADGGRANTESIVCARGVCLAPLQRGGPNSCTALPLTRDYFATTIAPQANTGPSATGVSFTGAGLGVYGYPTTRSECSSINYLQYRQFGFAQDWGGTPPRVGAPGYQFPVTHNVGTDAWIYHFAYTNGIENFSVIRTPVNNIAVTQNGQTINQIYNGTGHGSDMLLDSNWTTITDAGFGSYKDFNEYPYGRRGTISWIGGGINRWVFLGFAPTPAPITGSEGYNDGSAGILAWDIGPYPTAMLDATLAGYIPPDPVNNPTFGPTMPQLLESSCLYPADGSVTCKVAVTGNFLNSGTDEYAPFYKWVRFVPRSQANPTPHTSWFGTKTTHIANGLDALWLMDMPVWSTTITDYAGPKAGKPNGYQVTGIATQLVVNDGDGLRTGWPQADSMTNPTPVTITTPYNVALTDLTVFLTFKHEGTQPVIFNEMVLDKTDFQILRDSSVGNSWKVKVGGTTSSAFSLSTDGAFVTLVVRRVGSAVTVYGNSGLGSTLPLTALTTFTDGTALGANALKVGSLSGGSQAFHGTIGQIAVFSRGLSDSELLSEMGVVRYDMASRTPRVLVP